MEIYQHFSFWEIYLGYFAIFWNDFAHIADGVG